MSISGVGIRRALLNRAGMLTMILRKRVFCKPWKPKMLDVDSEA